MKHLPFVIAISMGLIFAFAFSIPYIHEASEIEVNDFSEFDKDGWLLETCKFSFSDYFKYNAVVSSYYNDDVSLNDIFNFSGCVKDCSLIYLGNCEYIHNCIIPECSITTIKELM